METRIIHDVIEWDVHNWSNALNYWSQGVSKTPTEGAKVLCLGERNGGLSLWFALQGFHVMCSDFQGPREAAHKLHERYGVADRVQYTDISIFQIPFADNTFDIIACKSVIGGLKLDYKDKKTRTLENQMRAVDEVRRVLKVGGYFLGAENMRGSWLHTSARKLLKGEKIGWRHLNVSEMQQLFNGFESKSFNFFGFLGSYYKYDWVNRIGSGIDRMLSQLLPSRWLYIGFIVAKK